jgi:glucose-1-phosphate cytidylyltransferase
MFLANYADVLTNASLPDMITRFEASEAVASLLAVPPQSSHHAVEIGETGMITRVTRMQDLPHWENGGYFILRPEIFDELKPGEDLVEDAIARLVRKGRVLAYPYKGYWSPADTVKERAQLEEQYQRADCPWMIWDPDRSGGGAAIDGAATDGAALNGTALNETVLNGAVLNGAVLNGAVLNGARSIDLIAEPASIGG